MQQVSTNGSCGLKIVLEMSAMAVSVSTRCTATESSRTTHAALVASKLKIQETNSVALRH